MSGIVVKEINFLPPRIKKARESKRQKLFVLAASLVLAAITGLAVWYPFMLEKKYLAKSRELDQKIAILNQAAPVYNQMLEKQKEYEQKKEALAKLEKVSFKVIPYLENIATALPPGAYITHMSVITDEGVNMTFITRDPVDTAALVVGLRRLGLFASVDIESVPFMDVMKPVQLNLRFKWAEENKKDNNKMEANKEPDKGAEMNAAIKEIESKIKTK